MQAWCHPRTLKRNSRPKSQRQRKTEQKVTTAPKQVLMLPFIYIRVYLKNCWSWSWVSKGQKKKTHKKDCKWLSAGRQDNYFPSRKTMNSSTYNYCILKQWVCAILLSIPLLWQHVSSLSVRRRRRTRELRVMASTTALKTLIGSLSIVVPLSTMALSALYWKKETNSVFFLSSTGFSGMPWKNRIKYKDEFSQVGKPDHISQQHCKSATFIIVLPRIKMTIDIVQVVHLFLF